MDKLYLVLTIMAIFVDCEWTGDFRKVFEGWPDTLDDIHWKL